MFYVLVLWTIAWNLDINLFSRIVTVAYSRHQSALQNTYDRDKEIHTCIHTYIQTYRDGSSFFPRVGVDPTTMRSIVHEPRSGEPIFFFYFEPP